MVIRDQIQQIYNDSGEALKCRSYLIEMKKLAEKAVDERDQALSEKNKLNEKIEKIRTHWTIVCGDPSTYKFSALARILDLELKS